MPLACPTAFLGHAPPSLVRGRLRLAVHCIGQHHSAARFANSGAAAVVFCADHSPHLLRAPGRQSDGVWQQRRVCSGPGTRVPGMTHPEDPAPWANRFTDRQLSRPCSAVHHDFDAGLALRTAHWSSVATHDSEITTQKSARIKTVV